MVAGLWADHARVLELRKDEAGRIEALERAYELAPFWSWVGRSLGLACAQQENLEKARAVLESLAARAPFDAYTLGCLAEVIWKQGEREAALERLKRAVAIEPGYDWGWSTL